MKKFYVKLSKLNNWANSQFRTVMQEFSPADLQIQTPYGSIRKLTIHLISTLNHWFDFFDTTFAITWRKPEFDYHHWPIVLELWTNTDARFEQIIDSFPDAIAFDQLFSYSHNKQELYQMQFGELFLHLTTHSYYHRGQLALIFRQQDLPIAPPTDADDYFKILISGT